MSVRAYVLLDIVDGNSRYALHKLRGNSGVVLADRLDGAHDVIVMVEAPDRQKLAEIIMPVIGCVDNITEDLHLLVTQDGESPPTLPMLNLFNPVEKSYKKRGKETRHA